MKTTITAIALTAATATTAIANSPNNYINTTENGVIREIDHGGAAYNHGNKPIISRDMATQKELNTVQGAIGLVLKDQGAMIQNNTSEIYRVDQEDHRVVDATVNSDGYLVLHSEDMDGGTKRDKVTGVNIAAGTNGADGAKGQQGIQGVKGNTGATGQQGIQGVKGDTGSNGANGIDGKDGTNGINGTNGKDGTNGVDGKDGNDGAVGDTGAAGTNGTNGVDGNDGTNGIDGVDGNDGAVGAVGATGDKGDTGDVGKDGSDGNDGRDAVAPLGALSFAAATSSFYGDGIGFGLSDSNYGVLEGSFVLGKNLGSGWRAVVGLTTDFNKRHAASVGVGFSF